MTNTNLDGVNGNLNSIKEDFNEVWSSETSINFNESLSEINSTIDKINEEINIFYQAIEKVEKYKVIDEPIKPSSETTMKKYHKQFLKTDTGIEIKIPMQEYENKDSVEFITNEDGTISVLIKNVEKIVSK